MDASLPHSSAQSSTDAVCTCRCTCNDGLQDDEAQWSLEVREYGQPIIDALCKEALASGAPPVSLADAIVLANDYLQPRLTSRFPIVSVACTEGVDEDLEPTGNLCIACTFVHPYKVNKLSGEPELYGVGAEWGAKAFPALGAMLPKIEDGLFRSLAMELAPLSA